MEQLSGLLGALYLGTLLNVALFGVIWGQVVDYLRHYQRDRDRPVYLYAVLACWLIGAAHTALSIRTMWTYAVSGWGQPAVLSRIPWSFALDPLFTALVAAVVQCFYCYRVYLVSNRKLVLPILIGALTAFQLAWGIFDTYSALGPRRWVDVEGVTWAVTIFLFSMAAGDILITGSLSKSNPLYFLSRVRSDFQETNSILDKVIAVTIANNGLTCISAMSSAILFCTGPGAWHLLPGLAIIHFYNISFLSSLNSRQQLARDLALSRACPRPTPTPINFLPSSSMSLPPVPVVFPPSASPSPAREDDKKRSSLPKRPAFLRMSSTERGRSLRSARSSLKRGESVGRESAGVQVTIECMTVEDTSADEWDPEKRGAPQKPTLAIPQDAPGSGNREVWPLREP
ncbi:hypothetical protein JCM5296_006871 [Sporobolomyces johnsonii]